MSDDGKGARFLCSGGDIPLADGTPSELWAVAKWPDAPAGRANFGLVGGDDGAPAYVASPAEWAAVQRAAGLGPTATGADVVAAIKSPTGGEAMDLATLSEVAEVDPDLALRLRRVVAP